MKRKAFIHAPRSYVVRVYRVMRCAIVGQIEDVQSGTARSFSSADELWSAIGARRCRAGRKRGGGLL
jgi:hypothetical protein